MLSDWEGQNGVHDTKYMRHDSEYTREFWVMILPAWYSTFSRPLSNSCNVSETPILPLFRLEEAPNIVTAYRPSSDFRLHSVYYFPLHSQHPLPSPLSASKLQGLPVIHLRDSQIPNFIQHILSKACTCFDIPRLRRQSSPRSSDL
jgi:hypothetical protein